MLKDSGKIVIDTTASVIGAGVGYVIGNMPGALIGGVITPVLSEVLTRSLSKKEVSRIELVAKLAIENIEKEIKRGSKIKESLDNVKASELFEGTLLKAKNVYEIKKIPLIANLYARSVFTNTPVENINQCLILAEQLSYRQLCLLSIVGQQWWKGLGGLVQSDLSSKKFMDETSKANDEFAEGTYHDIFNLMNIELITQFTHDGEHLTKINHSGLIVPALLTPMYMGRIMYNSMSLDEINNVDIDKLKSYLI